MDIIKSLKDVFGGSGERKSHPTQVYRKERLDVYGEYKFQNTKERLDCGVVCSGIVSRIENYGVIVEIRGKYKGLVHKRNMSQQRVQNPSYMFYEGQKIKVQVLGYDEKERLQLGVKQLQHISDYEVGKEIRIRLSYVIDAGIKFVTDDENLVVGFIPNEEIAWYPADVDAVKFGLKKWVPASPKRKIMAKVISEFKGEGDLKCSLKALQPNPWIAAKLEKNKVIEIEIVERRVNGICIVTTDEWHLPGFVFTNQITWKRSTDLLEEDYPSIGARVRAVVAEFNPEMENLKCSIKALQPNPWKDLKPGNCVEGKVLGGFSGHYNIELKNGLSAVCFDNCQLSLSEIVSFVVLSIDRKKDELVVSFECYAEDQKLRGIINDFFSTQHYLVENVKDKSNKRQLIMWAKDGYEALLLLPQQIRYNDEAISLPFSLYFLYFFVSHPETLESYKVVQEFGNGKYALISIDLVDYPQLYQDFKVKYVIGEDLTTNAICKTVHYDLIAISGVMGYVKRIPSDDENAKGMRAKIVDEGQSTLRLQRFEHSSNSETLIKQRELCGIDQLLEPDEFEVVDERDKRLIMELLKNVPSLKRKTINICTQIINIAEDDRFSMLKCLLDKKENYLESHKFYITSRYDKKGKQFVLIYNEDNFVLELVPDEMKFNIRMFSFRKSSLEAQNLLNAQKRIKPLIVAGKNLHIINRYDIPVGYNVAQVSKNIAYQSDIVNRILPFLTKVMRERKESYGKNYITLAKYLDFQQERENIKLQDREVMIPANNARYGGSSVNTDNAKICLKIDRNLCAVFFEEIDANEIKLPVEIIKNEEKCNGYIEDDFDGFCVLSFNKQNINLKDYIAAGFTIRYRPNIKHLKLQERRIKEFVAGNLLANLKEGKLEEPNVDENVVFKDEKFNHVEPGNNQPMAIRKALGCKDVFLIQGPPGTGKTSVIVEIVRQFAERGERVLVCSQAHSAVENVYERLCRTELKDCIGFLDEPESMHGMSAQEHERFLENNSLLLDRLSKRRNEVVDIKDIVGDNDYSDVERKDFLRQHEYINENHNRIKDYITIKRIIDDFRKDVAEQDDSSMFYATGHLRSLKVVMGTCIGVGMYGNIQRSGILFDTVIIDEAGKANYGETIVPMCMGKKYILVGDQRQLPPYMDREDMKEFLGADSKNDVDPKGVENALGSSLFEDFLHDDKFPAGSKILLNYQYRMNSDLGDYVSKLFYKGELRNGEGTEKQCCDLDGFPDAVTFRDTRNEKGHYENSNGKMIYNLCEIDIICNEIVPKLENQLLVDERLSVGIVAPYREQVYRLRDRLKGSLLMTKDSNGIYTIDSIQGREFDIVVLSFVRSFEPKKGNKVGFLDDMRRLNVALSRARKKLILVGDLETLTRSGSHRKFDTIEEVSLQPERVFQAISENSKRYVDFDMITQLKQFVAAEIIKKGTVLKDCEIIEYVEGKKKKCAFRTKVEGVQLQFPIPSDDSFVKSAIFEKELRDVLFCGFEKGRPVWHLLIEARIIEFDEKEVTIEERHSGHRKKGKRNSYYYFDSLLQYDQLDKLNDVWLPFRIDKNIVYLDFRRTELWEGNSALCRVIGEGKDFYSVCCGWVLGKVMKRKGIHLSVGEECECVVYKRGRGKVIIFNRK